jgi:histidinol dehydrogenase
MIDAIGPDEFRKKERAGIPDEIFSKAGEILSSIRDGGFDALVKCSSKFDGFNLNQENLMVDPEEIKTAKDKLTREQKEAIDEAFNRVLPAQNEIAASQKEVRLNIGGGLVCLRSRPIERAGIYVPGGLASLPSSLLMAGVAARAAGVAELVVCTPPQTQISPAILYVAGRLGITKIYRIGGAQAIAAMAYGIENKMKKVDMICGPGNIFVAAAKQLASSSGAVKVDLVAGPSEVLIIADKTARADYVAADMLAQAEHGVNSPAILLTTSKQLAKEVSLELAGQLGRLDKSCIAEKSLRDYGAIVITKTIDGAIEISNDYAPEHLEIIAKNANLIANKISNAGAVFVNTCESFADYGMSGGNHILPTGGTARFLSGLSALDFMVRSYVEIMSDEEQRKLSEKAGIFADLEGLEAHAKAARLRGGKS